MQQSLLDQQVLLKSLSKGDRTAFWQLWIPLQDYLYHRCLTWMDGNIPDAKDALSKATLKAWEQLFLHADNIINLKAWVIRFTHNLCIDIHRESRTKAIGVDNIEEIPLEKQVLIFPFESPESTILGSEMETNIRCAINTLSPRLRSPFIMHFEQDMSYLDTAQKLGISIDCVYKRISEARAILQPQMKNYLSQENDFTFFKIPSSSIKKEKPTEANRNKAIQEELPPILTQSRVGSDLQDERMQCLYCQSTHINKNGKKKAKQNYLCQKCGRQFVDCHSCKGYSLEVRERCLKLHTSGIGYRAISRETGVNPNTVINWVRQQTIP